MANLRVSTDQQSTARQNLVLHEAGIEDSVTFEEAPGTSSRLHPLRRPKFRALLDYARPGDTVHISEMFRLVHGTGHILDVFDTLNRDRLALRIHDGASSAMNLTARQPRTGELLSTVKFMVQTLAAGGDLQRELTYDGCAPPRPRTARAGVTPPWQPRRPTTYAPSTWTVARSPPSPATTGSAAAPSVRRRQPPAPTTPSVRRTRPPRSCRFGRSGFELLRKRVLLYS
ncbi:recombinase family protein [Streptomyces sp. NPDC087917]|uniref:recombinase family protein n=1 Tax=Streptomyces sp. NPDC087917 TaxID=3155060 RepID=UPI0034236D17